MGSSASILSTSALENATTSELLSNLLFPADEFANELVGVLFRRVLNEFNINFLTSSV